MGEESGISATQLSGRKNCGKHWLTSIFADGSGKAEFSTCILLHLLNRAGDTRVCEHKTEGTGQFEQRALMRI